MEDQTGHTTDMGERGRAASIGRPTYDECRAVNVINPLGLPDHGEGSLHRVINSLTNSDSSNGSWDPVRELCAIVGGGEAPIESQLRAQQDDAIHLQAVEIATAEARHL